MTDVDDWSDPTYDGYEPDGGDYEEQRAEEEYWEHCDAVHGGKKCTCPRPSLDVELAELARAHRDEAHAGGECTCPPDEPPF